MSSRLCLIIGLVLENCLFLFVQMGLLEILTNVDPLQSLNNFLKKLRDRYVG